MSQPVYLEETSYRLIERLTLDVRYIGKSDNPYDRAKL
jgi:hypothetical protein